MISLKCELEFRHRTESLLMPQANATIQADHPIDASDVLRMPAVVRHTGLSRSTIYRLMATRHFPVPVKLASRAVGWRKSDVVQWNKSLPSVPH